MAYQALYRKYRPQTFSEVVGQEHITETLKNQLRDGKTSHAYLFTGTRGTGKTSCAKILAKAVNCLGSKDGNPCLECESCLAIAEGENTDIVEIDAASNNGVDDIRELRDLVSFAPASSKYRVYIIDEVHMLTISAFNALLKTLEEPPAHAVFILATTEVHKLPATILSRCQRYDFRRIESEKICERIKYICEKEGLTVTDEAALLIAAAADGGMRDALSILDLCASSSKNIDENTVESVCAMAGSEYLLSLADCIKEGDCERALLLIDELHNSSVDMLRLLAELTSHYRDLMIVKTVKSDKKPIVCSAARLKALKEQADSLDIKEIMYCISVLQSSALAFQAGNRRCEIEMAVHVMCNPELSEDIAALERRVSRLEKGGVLKKNPPIKSEEPIKPKQDDIPTIEDDIPLPEEPQESTKAGSEDITPVDNWNEILMLIKSSNPLFAGVLVGSKGYIKGQYLLIDAPNPQFREMINMPASQHKDSIRKAAEKVLGVTYKLGPYIKKSAEPQESDPLHDLANKLKQFEI